MFPGSTLFFDVCAQRDFWAGGAWPLLDGDAAANVASLFALAAGLRIRQAGVCCWHASQPHGVASAAASAGSGVIPAHCAQGTDGAARAPGCMPCLPLVVVVPASPAPGLDRAHAYWVASGCDRVLDADATSRTVVDHVTAGIRNAVVFGAGLEYGITHVIDALLRRRVRTHLVLDAVGAADAAIAQQVVDTWKRRGVDGLTTATVTRLLARA